MEQKNYTEVFIDGTVFTLGGTEDEAYLRQVAAYLNEKIGEVRKLDGFSRQSPEYQNLTIQLNLSDDYFKEQMRADDLKQQKEELEACRYQELGVVGEYSVYRLGNSVEEYRSPLLGES